MSIVAGSMIYKDYAFFHLNEHFTQGGAICAYAIAAWQFTAVLYAITQSYKLKAEAVTKVLFEHHPAWGQVEPGYGDPLMFHGNDRQSLQVIESRGRQKDRDNKSS